MNIEFTGKIWFWKGPAPWFFVTIPPEQSRHLKAISGFVTYGWGVIPVRVRTGKTEFPTSLFPKMVSTLYRSKQACGRLKIWRRVTQ